MLKLIVFVLATIIIVNAKTFESIEEVSVTDGLVNDTNSESTSTEIEEGRIRHHHVLPFYGGLCKAPLYGYDLPQTVLHYM